MKQKWSQENRRELYRRLINEIGPHRNWDAKIRPIRERVRYNSLLEELANEFSEKVSRRIETTAIQQQINWATTTQVAIRHRSHVRSFMMNKAAAHEVGFIESSDLPMFITVSN